MSRNQSKTIGTESQSKPRRKENKPLCQLHLEVGRELRYQFHGAEYAWEDEKYTPFPPWIKYRIKTSLNALAHQYGLDRENLNMGQLYIAAVRARREETQGVSTQNLLIDRIIYHVLEHYRERLSEQRQQPIPTSSTPPQQARQPDAEDRARVMDEATREALSLVAEGAFEKETLVALLNAVHNDDPDLPELVRRVKAGEWILDLTQHDSADEASEPQPTIGVTRQREIEGKIKKLRARMEALDFEPQNEACRFQLETEIHRLEHEADEWTGFDVLDA